MQYVVSDRGVHRSVRRITASVGEEVRRLREDAGLSRMALARAASVDDSYLGRIEAGRAMPSIETIARLSIALGADLAVRLYPSTGSPIRDRHSAPISAALIELLHPRWRPFPECAVQRPARGWIDLGLHDTVGAKFVASEIQSELRRLEQGLRWSQSKADSLPSWEGWPHLRPVPEISRLLVVRETRANRSVVRASAALLRAAYPANPHAALESLTRGTSWPGAGLLWAVRDRTRAGSYRIAVRD